jgi:hypothetical protein
MGQQRKFEHIDGVGQRYIVVAVNNNEHKSKRRFRRHGCHPKIGMN